MFATIPTTTEALSLDELIGRLTSHAAIDGILVMGSAGDGTLNPASDYDLYVVLSSMPKPRWRWRQSAGYGRQARPRCS